MRFVIASIWDVFSLGSLTNLSCIVWVLLLPVLLKALAAHSVSVIPRL